MAHPHSPDGNPPAVRKRMTGKVHLGLAVAGVAGLALVFYGWHWWQHGRYQQDTDDAYVGGDITVISAKVPGYIATVAVSDNQVVHAGDLLARLDDRDYRAALARAELATEILFGREIQGLSDAELADIFGDVPSRQLERNRLEAGIDLISLLVEMGASASKGEARRAVGLGGEGGVFGGGLHPESGWLDVAVAAPTQGWVRPSRTDRRPAPPCRCARAAGRLQAA
jgi:multidrug efflux pump subunit AcrA (membrane-fusion protein)